MKGRCKVRFAERGREVLTIELEALEKVRGQLGIAFEQVVDRVLQVVDVGGKVVVTGLGKSFHIGQKISSTLISTGTPSAVLHPSEAMHGDLGILGENDLLLAISYSGASDELMTLVPIVKRLHIQVITMTGVLDSPLALCSDAVLPVLIEREACPFNMVPTASTTAMLAVGDALAIVVLEARGFRREDYARLHPGGAIGRTLLMRVTDIMRTGDRLPVVDLTAQVMDAVIAMTRCRAGSVAIINAAGKLAGVFTDGDLRRHIAEGTLQPQQALEEVMIHNPKTIVDSALAVDVLRYFERYNIDDLIVINKDHQVVGLIDIQDLPKLKIL